MAALAEQNWEESNLNLESLGWSEELQDALQSFLTNATENTSISVGRVCTEHREFYRVLTEIGEVSAQVSGKLRYNARSRHDFPTVGDWVALENVQANDVAVIRGVLPRKSLFVRKEAGSTHDEQLVAANVDTVFLVSSLNQDLNLRRLERYLIMAWDSGADPVIILTKADLYSDVSTAVEAVSGVAMGVPIHVISALTDLGVSELERYLQPGRTVALLGSSGVGKSTLLNRMAESDIQAVKSIRQDDDRGRHTTTSRSLIVLPSGALAIDTPGMRELHLGAAETGFESSFRDIESLAENCHFRDCGHNQEPGCAVQDAVATGMLDAARLNSYRKLQRELAYQKRKEDERAQLVERNRRKQITKQHRKQPIR